MFSFIGSFILLILGFLIYSKIVEKIFGADVNNPTPATRINDKVDYVPLPWWRSFLIQFLNIAGLGPVFGAVAGAVWGPVAYLWIVLGTIFAGATHDYLVGMISLRNNGATISEIIWKYLGSRAKILIRLFSLILLVLIGVVFSTGPAKLLGKLFNMPDIIWLYIIISYYFFATFLPIDKIISKIYPLFAILVLFMETYIFIILLTGKYHIPEINFQGMHPGKMPVWPFLFITIACGAISGFHATQSPIISRCLANEKHGRKVFYGAMVFEAFIAMIWASSSIAFYGDTAKLNETLKSIGAAGVVNDIRMAMVGGLAGIVSIIGVISLSITSGDTAFRSARLQLSEMFNLDQKSLANRLKLTCPMFITAIILFNVDFSIIWRYFSWSNQTLAALALWAGAVYLKKSNKPYWIALFPAIFMTAVTISYIIAALEGFNLSVKSGTYIGIIISIISLLFFIFSNNNKKNNF
ncbi:carbon starvation protein A [Candidatus Dependentiae bacterium]|nr:carbon starvation protein A [Candidatus Dependentiae bacterium]